MGGRGAWVGESWTAGTCPHRRTWRFVRGGYRCKRDSSERLKPASVWDRPPSDLAPRVNAAQSEHRERPPTAASLTRPINAGCLRPIARVRGVCMCVWHQTRLLVFGCVCVRLGRQELFFITRSCGTYAFLDRSVDVVRASKWRR